MTGPLGALGQHDILSDAAKLRTLLATCRVCVYNNANISIANGVWTTLTFNSERWDTDGMHSMVANTDRLTCVIPGLYFILANIAFAANANGSRRLRILLNGATNIALASTLDVTAGFLTPIALPRQYELSINDYVIVQAYQDTGAALNVLYGVQYSPEFMMARIG